MPKRPLIGWLTSPDLSEKAASATAGSMMSAFVTMPRSVSLSLRPRSLARSAKDCALGDALARGRGFLRVLKHDLAHFALFRRAVLAFVLLVILLGVGIGDRVRLGDVGRRQRQQRDLAVFRRAEQNLALVEIFLQHVRRRGGDIAGLRRPERQIFDGALLVLILIDRRHGGRRHVQIAGDAFGDLPAQQHVALLIDKAGFGIAGLADDLLEKPAVELAVRPAEIRIVGDAADDVGIADAEAQRLGLLVERGFGDQVAERLPVEAERARLVGRDRAAEPAAELAQLVVIKLAKLLDRDFGVADLDRRIEAEAAENVADAPDREADDQDAHDERP